MSEKKKELDKKTILDIVNNYQDNAEALVKELYFKVEHGSTIGTYREGIWKEMFEQIIPKKFVIEQSVFIIDADGRVSKEVDLAIFDNNFTPYIFRYKNLKFLPIEAVAVVVECKSTSMNKKVLQEWEMAIKELKTANKACARMAAKIVRTGDGFAATPTQTATRPLRILCYLSEDKIKIEDEIKSENKTERECLNFDITIQAIKEKKLEGKKAEKGRLKITFSNEFENLQDWYKSLNHVDGAAYEGKIDEGEVLQNIKLNEYTVHKGKNKEPISLLSFNLQLNQLLTILNNPVLFPNKSYAEMFNDKCREEK